MRRIPGIAALLLAGASIAAAQPKDATVHELSPEPSEAAASPETWETAYGYSTAMGSSTR